MFKTGDTAMYKGQLVAVTSDTTRGGVTRVFLPGHGYFNVYDGGLAPVTAKTDTSLRSDNTDNLNSGCNTQQTPKRSPEPRRFCKDGWMPKQNERVLVDDGRIGNIDGRPYTFERYANWPWGDDYALITRKEPHSTALKWEWVESDKLMEWIEPKRIPPQGGSGTAPAKTHTPASYDLKPGHAFIGVDKADGPEYTAAFELGKKIAEEREAAFFDAFFGLASGKTEVRGEMTYTDTGWHGIGQFYGYDKQVIKLGSLVARIDNPTKAIGRVSEVETKMVDGSIETERVHVEGVSTPHWWYLINFGTTPTKPILPLPRLQELYRDHIREPNYDALTEDYAEHRTEEELDEAVREDAKNFANAFPEFGMPWQFYEDASWS